MALYAIGDLHLSLGTNKPMDVFGPKWANYVERIRENFSKLNDDDVIVIAGGYLVGDVARAVAAGFSVY